MEKSDIVHQSVYELVHSEDREELQRQLMWNSFLPAESAGLSLQEALQPDRLQLLERSFTVRFRCLLDNTSGFLVSDSVQGLISPVGGRIFLEVKIISSLVERVNQCFENSYFFLLSFEDSYSFLLSFEDYYAFLLSFEDSYSFLLRRALGGLYSPNFSVYGMRHDSKIYVELKRKEAKKLSPTLNLETNSLKVTPPMAGLLARTGSLSGHPSKQEPRSTLLDPVILR
ncbi:hypothetical protein J6590_066315 [Homalodisca vitripennis]|nr:hypothetical protein J6590_066315 [Homalodisca vitripennis]